MLSLTYLYGARKVIKLSLKGLRSYDISTFNAGKGSTTRMAKTGMFFHAFQQHCALILKPLKWACRRYAYVAARDLSRFVIQSQIWYNTLHCYDTDISAKYLVHLFRANNSFFVPVCLQGTSECYKSDEPYRWSTRKILASRWRCCPAKWPWATGFQRTSRALLTFWYIWRKFLSH